MKCALLPVSTRGAQKLTDVPCSFFHDISPVRIPVIERCKTGSFFFWCYKA
jgi:hypothetical protein